MENVGSKAKPPKQGPFQSKQGSTMGSRFTQIIVYIYIHAYTYTEKQHVSYIQNPHMTPLETRGGSRAKNDRQFQGFDDNSGGTFR